jgi:hypothetical protein
MGNLPGNENFLKENFQNGSADLSKFLFKEETLEQMAEAFEGKEKKQVGKFTENIREWVAPGIPLEKLVHLVVHSALEAEFGDNFFSSPGNRKVAAAIEKVILEDKDLLERVVAVALKAWVDKKKTKD